MATSPLGEQEFVAHVFAPLDGPHAELARQQTTRLWESCQSQLGMTQPIVAAGLTTGLPADPRAAPEGALAGLQDPALNFQAVARREHDVLNLSLVMVAPEAPPRRRRRIGSVAPPGWYEHTRWWRTLTAGGLGAMLGAATIYQAKNPDPARADVRAALPEQDDDAAAWWTRRSVVDGFALWEVTPGDDRAVRRFVVLARPPEDAQLSRLTWSDGDVVMPPLARYLMHAAKLRYQARVLGDGTVLPQVRNQVTTRLDQLVEVLRDPQRAAEVPALAAALAPEEAELVGTLAALHAMRRTVEIAGDNMASALPEPLPSDAALARLLTRQLADDTDYLEAIRVRAERVRAIVTTPAPSPPATTAIPEPRPDPAPHRDARMQLRLGFGVDVVEYSSRPVPRQEQVQRRLVALVEQVLDDVGLRLHDTDRQDSGDGMMVVLPPGLEPHRILPRLLHGWRTHLVADNGAHPDDRVRLRLSVAAGLMANSAAGFTGSTIIELGRLLDSAALRDAVVDRPDADLVALVSDRLHADVVAEGHPGLDPEQFERIEVAVKSYRASAWLWTGAAGSPRPVPTPVVGAGPDAPDRDVLVVHGSAERARSALFDLLRALGLRPLEWNELVDRTGRAAPYRQDVLSQTLTEDRAVVVLIAPADGGTGHVDPDVLLAAGMALARQPDRTIIVEVGAARPIPGLAGRETVRLDGTSSKGRHQLAQRLRVAGCPVDTTGTDWLDLGGFADL